MTGVRRPGLIIIISADKKQRVWGFPFIIDNQTEMARLQQGDGVGAGEDEGDGEAVAGGDQHWDWGTFRTDQLHTNCILTRMSGNRGNFVSSNLW